MSDTTSEQQQNDEVGTPTDEVIASFIWCDGHICVSYYNVSSLELYITYEKADLRPDFCHLHNLFRIIPNMRNVIASGPDVFLKAVMKLLGLPDIDPTRYRLHNLKSLSAATFIVYANNEKTLHENRQRILEMHMPRMPASMTLQDRFNFVETVVPLHQTLVVQCLGNLLHFLDANWRHLFLREETRPVISDLQVYKLDGNVLIDESTFSTLQVFALKDHPSAFKKGATHAPTTNNGPSLYGVMNTCVSRLGSNQLKTWLYQPINGIDELRRRHRMIEWCRNEKNAVNLTKFRAALKKIVSAGELYARLIRTRGKPSVWKTFKRTLYYTKEIADICIALIKSKSPDCMDTVIQNLGNFASENTEVRDMLTHVDTIIDLDASVETGLFCIRSGLDSGVDEKKEQLNTVAHELLEKVQEEFQAIDLPLLLTEFKCHCMPEMGFLIAIPSNHLAVQDIQASNRFKLAYRQQETLFFTSQQCEEMSKQYGHLHVEIRERQQEICDRLMECLYERLYDIHHTISFCGQLDCLMAMASFSLKFDLVCPEIVSDRKVLSIKDGRHILVGIQQKCIPNDTNVSVDQKNLINILIAPNASGKSVYMKEVAQITYLAHIGSYVPAAQATIPAVDAIYTRMYCNESLYLSKSSYLVELQQMSNVIMNSSSKSLILVDEMGQGTTETDGKSLLIACLRHLARRGSKAPISFVTTHYTDVYDHMSNTEWVSMKTFEMVPAARGGLISTYKVIEGRCAARYAKDCALLRRFMEPDPTNTAACTNAASGRTSSADNASCYTANPTKQNNDVATDRDQETLEHIDDTIRNKKILCAAKVLQAFLRKQPNEKVNYMEIINGLKI